MTADANPVSSNMTPEDAIDPNQALVPSVQQVNEVRVNTGFWPKMKKVAARIPFADQVLSVWYAAKDPQTPATAKGIMFGALAYFVLPVDAIPDIFAGIGFTDDAAVIAALLATLGSNIKSHHRDQARQALRRLADD
ncbi:MAG: DUF1232 domain-containing protein [Brevundimonas sp.]|nr:MAG: DUF1232 domain-containing protein [Brevundimonas sp.]